MPYAVPISYAWKDGLIHMHCAAGVGKKLENVAHCSDVCFVIVGDTKVLPEKFGTLYESVIIMGKMKKTEDKVASLVALLEKYSTGLVEKGMNYVHGSKGKTDTYVIEPYQITGKAKRRG